VWVVEWDEADGREGEGEGKGEGLDGYLLCGHLGR